MTDLLLPSTNGGVFAQLLALAVAGPIGVAATWKHREIRTFVIGLIVALAAWMALRTVH